MKHICILIVTLSGIFSLSAQNSWEDYTKVADSLELLSQFKQVLDCRGKAVEIASVTTKDTIPYLELLRNISQNESLIEDKNSKEEAYNNLKSQIEELKMFSPNPDRLYRIYNRLYKASSQSNNIDDSDYFITQSLENQYKSSAIDSLMLLETLQNAGATYKQIGKLNESVAMFQKAEIYCQDLKIEDASMLGFNYMNLSELHRYRYLDNPKKFIEYLKKAQDVYENAHAVDDMIRVYLGLSDFKSSEGDFEQSINYLKKAFRAYKEDVEEYKKEGLDKSNINLEMKLHNYFIEKYRMVGNEKSMLYHLNEMLKKATPKVLNDNIKDLISLSHLYLVEYYENDNIEQALIYLNQGSKFFPTEDLYFIRQEYDMHYVNIFMKKNEYDKAQTILKALSETKGLPLFIAKTTLEKRIILNIKSEKYDDAFSGINAFLIRYYDANEATDIRTLAYKDFNPGTVLSDTQRFLNIAKELEATPNDQVTENLYWLALKQFQANLNQEILSDRVNLLYADVCYYFYTKASNKALSPSKLNQFITFTETIESKHLLNTFINNRIDSHALEIDSLINKEQKIRANITYLKKQNIEKPIDSINQLIFEDNLKLENINEQLKKNSNRMAGLVNTENILEQIKDNYIIKYKQVNNSLFRIEFNTTKDITVNEIKDYDILKDKIKETVALLKNPNSSPETIIKNTDFLFNKLLSDTIILKFSDTVYLILDDVLHYLPFELLTHNKYYLIENTTISYASALSFINNNSMAQTSDDKKNIALFAPSYKSFAPTNAQLAVRGTPYYLEGTLNEVKAISKLFANSDLYINDKASKESFKNLSKDYSILHLSMHSFINDQEAELSSLVFSDNDKDYELYISELYGLNLNADMAVLSACNTGVGEFKTGKGIVSMNTAFTAAGVPSVLSSLWSAPDEATEKIMTSFYKHLKKGETKSEALKNAKLDYLKITDDPNLKHPYYWAGFVLTGDTSAIVSSTNYWLYGVVTFVLILIVFIIAKRRLIPKP
ncbi:CHAT domain-containing protein [Winogradskyella vidalii]|uniref:CHAT domain-containing protein n=1 Tax=Winogradskyella vidalii TaxID=2615024 RepID=UPI0015CE0D18|nr:CHAT domain-containing protein [Winogradskyella vidalii]